MTYLELATVQLAGGGLVPLSHAVCCRPCLPDSLPEDPTGTIQANDSAVAVISIGCHASTAVGATLISVASRSACSRELSPSAMLQPMHALTKEAPEDGFFPLKDGVNAVQCFLQS